MTARNTADPKYKVGTFHSSNNFGDFEVVSYKKSTDVTVRFLDTGCEKVTTVKAISLGTVKDPMKPNLCGVGFIGVGDFSSKSNGKDTKSYSVWRGMIRRCYDSKSKSYNRYGGRGVFVCDEWLNYQNFASWYIDNYPRDGRVYEIDKDLTGGKVYSPSACNLVTHKDNMAIVSMTSKRS